MSPDFETWLMRGMVVGLLGILGTLILRRWKGQDQRDHSFREALDTHRNATEATLKEFRSEFMSHLDRLRASNETSLSALNQTMAEVARTAGDIRARMAERYATKKDLADFEERVEKRFGLCSSSCPVRRE